ncbi:MAG: hypothetical protein ACJASQ_001207 [Crocinitomicaceae bacterium]|jgi:hypothetical protein
MAKGTLLGNVQNAPSGLKGFDADTVITAAVAAQFKAQGYTFCVRYLSIESAQSNDLTPAEANIILDSGLALIPVQHVRRAGWSPSGLMGTAYGTYAAENAAIVGFPERVSVWCDLEGIEQGTSAADVIDYCNNWYDAVFSQGYVPGLYVGAGCILNSAQLYLNLKFQHYWKSESNVPDVDKRGFQLVQHFHGQPVNGIGIDIDITQTDNLGGQVAWLFR